MNFKPFRDRILENYKALAKKSDTLFIVDYEPFDNQKIWELYLDTFPEDIRQEYNCNCCRRFLQQYGGIVAIENNEIVSLWRGNEDLEPIFAKASAYLKNFIESLEIKSAFFSKISNLGEKATYDLGRNLYWDHFFLEVKAVENAEKKMANSIEQKDMFEKAESELGYNAGAIDTVLTLIKNNDLYRATAQTKKTLKTLKAALIDLSRTNNKELAYWKYCTNAEITRLKNTSLGVLLTNLSAGEDVEKALAKYNSITDPAKYRRNKGKVTTVTLNRLKAKLEEKGYINAINRRHISPSEVPLSEKIFTKPAKAGGSDFFEQLSDDIKISPTKLRKTATEISLEDFLTKIAPETSTIHIVPEEKHLSNLVSLIGPEDETSPSMFEWDNSYSWSYAGQFADAVTQRVKRAGGKVDALVTITLFWENRDDLDLHLQFPCDRIVYHNTMEFASAKARLDVDANYTSVIDDPVEHIYIDSAAYINKHKNSEFKLKVRNHKTRNKSAKSRQGKKTYSIKLEYKGQAVIIPCKSYPRQNSIEELISFKIDPEKGIILPDEYKELLTAQGDGVNVDKWGISTNKLVEVNAITVSPNYWGENSQGNKHYIFVLDGCATDEDMHPFFNEQLSSELREFRQVLEALSEKAQVAPSDTQISGLGFSSTKKADFLAQVSTKEGNKKQLFKVKVTG